MKNLCFTHVVTLYVVFLCFSLNLQAQPGNRPSFAVWDCDGQGMMAPPPSWTAVGQTMALLDSVSYAFPTGTTATDVKFVFQFEDSSGKILDVLYPVVGSKAYELTYNLSSLPADVTLSTSPAGMDLSFRLNTQTVQPTSGSFIKVYYEVWTQDASVPGSVFKLLDGQTKTSWYKHSLSCNKLMGKARVGLFGRTEIQANPNPFNDYLYIVAETETSVVKIMDSQGRTIRVLTVPAGDRPVRFPTEDIPAGLYFLQKQTSYGIETLPMVKTH
ncbi:MAG: T9SS type A sorting domain-containing protein [Bacteroidia bacterium]|nr:T9SS type A sorting domain-containing protein [Bacteroidia bacterium]